MRPSDDGAWRRVNRRTLREELERERAARRAAQSDAERSRADAARARAQAADALADAERSAAAAAEARLAAAAAASGKDVPKAREEETRCSCLLPPLCNTHDSDHSATLATMPRKKRAIQLTR